MHDRIFRDCIIWAACRNFRFVAVGSHRPSKGVGNFGAVGRAVSINPASEVKWDFLLWEAHNALEISPAAHPYLVGNLTPHSRIWSVKLILTPSIRSSSAFSTFWLNFGGPFFPLGNISHIETFGFVSQKPPFFSLLSELLGQIRQLLLGDPLFADFSTEILISFSDVWKF